METEKQPVTPPQPLPKPAPTAQEKRPETEAERAVRILKNVASIVDNIEVKGVVAAHAISEAGAYVAELIKMAEDALPNKETPTPAPPTPVEPSIPRPISETPNEPNTATPEAA